MRTLAVNEFFVTLQGEAAFAGTPAVFVRFQGCPVACPWCDTQYAARLDGATLDFAAVRAKQGPGAGYADVEPAALLAAIRQAGPRHVVLTGGEPCRHDLTELTSRLVAEGFRVQIETSGTMPIRCHAAVWVTLSPKLGMPGGLDVRQDAWERAGEIKFPVDTAEDLVRFEQALAAARRAAADGTGLAAAREPGEGSHTLVRGGGLCPSVACERAGAQISRAALIPCATDKNTRDVKGGVRRHVAFFRGGASVARAPGCFPRREAAGRGGIRPAGSALSPAQGAGSVLPERRGKDHAGHPCPQPRIRRGARPSWRPATVLATWARRGTPSCPRNEKSHPEVACCVRRRAASGASGASSRPA